MKKKRKNRQKSRSNSLNRYWILTGVVIAVAVILGAKLLSTGTTAAGDLPQDELDRALQANQPALAFYHSLNCDPCIRAMEVVGQVMPEYAGVITLVDVNVSDTANHALLREVGVRTIPAFYFYNRLGEVQVHYGVPAAEELRAALDGLEGGD